ncbi:MAG: hypothetical protein QM621_10850 [Aeromicrobium sp.]|uniref:GNAT family N-acetyltransferase, cg3035/Rv0428c family n=1 Tax=Aeromicrobium sp. TaxID=1871063 RepID=UPI0039E5D334
MDTQLVGRRISVRFRTSDGAASDVVGRVLAVDPLLRLERRDGTLATVDPDAVLILRVVPDRPLRTRRATAAPVDLIRRIAQRAWPAEESLPLDGWELRHTPGAGPRLNSALALESVDERLLAAARDFYAARGLPPLVEVEAGSALERQAGEFGWRPVGDRTRVLVAQLDRRWPVDAGVSVEAPGRATLRRGDATATVVVTGEWAGVTADDEALLAACLGWAVEAGADKAHARLDPADDESPWRVLGFLDHHDLAYLTSV